MRLLYNYVKMLARENDYRFIRTMYNTHKFMLSMFCYRKFRFIRTTYKISIYKMGFGRLIIARYSGCGSSPVARDYGSSGAKSIDLKFLKFTFLFFIISYFLTSKIRNMERYQKIYKEIFCVL